MDIDSLRDLNRTVEALEFEAGTLERQQLADRWVLLKQAADRLYSLSKQVGGELLNLADGETGFVPATSSRKIEVRRRFEVELLGARGEDEFSAWAADNDVNPFVTRIELSDEAKSKIRRVTLDLGDKIPGVSAGYGAPFLAIGRRP